MKKAERKSELQGEALHEEGKKTSKESADALDPHVTLKNTWAVRRRIADSYPAAAATPPPRHSPTYPPSHIECKRSGRPH